MQCACLQNRQGEGSSLHEKLLDVQIPLTADLIVVFIVCLLFVLFWVFFAFFVEEEKEERKGNTHSFLLLFFTNINSIMSKCCNLHNKKKSPAERQSVIAQLRLCLGALTASGQAQVSSTAHTTSSLCQCSAATSPRTQSRRQTHDRNSSQGPPRTKLSVPLMQEVEVSMGDCCQKSTQQVSKTSLLGKKRVRSFHKRHTKALR